MEKIYSGKINNEIVRLELPSERYLKSYIEAAFEDEKYSPETEKFFSKDENCLETFKNARQGINLPKGWVPAVHLWLVNDNEFIGQICVRKVLNNKLLNYGGTIGYCIRYSKRGQGYGTLMLKLCLQFCIDVLNIRKAMISCNVDNYASEKVILNNGGVFAEILHYNEEGKDVDIKKYWINIVPYIIDSERFYLREITEKDYDFLSEIYQDAENMKYFGAPYDDKTMQRLIDWTLSNYKKYGFGFWAIIDKATGNFIGDCGLSYQNIDGEWLPEIGYHINRKYHNQHYASEAARLVKEYIFKNYTFDALYGYTNEENIPSIKVMINNGMELFKKYNSDNESLVVYRVKR